MVSRQLLDMEPFRFTLLVARSVPVGVPTRVPGGGVLRLRAVVGADGVVANVRVDMWSIRAARALRRMSQPVSLNARAPMPDYALGSVEPHDAALTVRNLVVRRGWRAWWRPRRVTGTARTVLISDVWGFEVVRREAFHRVPPGD